MPKPRTCKPAPVNPSGITIDDILGAMRDTGPANQGDAGVSVQDIVDATGLRTTTIRKNLRVGITKGTIVAGRQYRTFIDGRNGFVPVYRAAKKS